MCYTFQIVMYTVRCHPGWYYKLHSGWTGKKQVRFACVISIFLFVYIITIIYIASISLPGLTSDQLQSINHLISVDMQRGKHIGNRMFQYASLIGIANLNNMTPLMPKDLSLRKIFLTTMTVMNSDISGNVDFRREVEVACCVYDKSLET